MARHVIIDTSSILFGFSNGRDVFSAADRKFGASQVIISKGVLRELRGIAKNSGKRGAAARLALEAVRARKPRIENNYGSVDEWIASEANDYKDAVVITNDTELLKRLRHVRASVSLFKLSRSGLLRGF